MQASCRKQIFEHFISVFKEVQFLGKLSVFYSVRIPIVQDIEIIFIDVTIIPLVRMAKSINALKNKIRRKKIRKIRMLEAEPLGHRT